MKKYLLLLTALVLAGCGDKSELELRMEHERAMARIQVEQVRAANQKSHTYVENEYEAPTNTFEDDSEEESYYDNSTGYSSGTGMDNVHTSTPTTTDNGYSGTSVAAAALAGAAVGHLATKHQDTIKEKSSNVATKVKKKANQLNKSPKVQKLKKKGKKVKEKVKYQARKAKVLSKKKIKKIQRKAKKKKR